MNKQIIWILVIALIAIGTLYMVSHINTPDVPIPLTQATTTITYTNTTYGFTLTLPKSWEGYTVLTGTLPFGYTVTLRHPLWTKENPYMDTPILVYPITQWKLWEANNFEGYPTAAPIGPTERGRNAQYVFATAPRYNYSFATDWETVEEIVKSLKGF
jgi:hypothetical protein